MHAPHHVQAMKEGSIATLNQCLLENQWRFIQARGPSCFV
jgi:hypothetical protein